MNISEYLFNTAACKKSAMLLNISAVPIYRNSSKKPAPSTATKKLSDNAKIHPTKFLLGEIFCGIHGDKVCKKKASHILKTRIEFKLKFLFDL